MVLDKYQQLITIVDVVYKFIVASTLFQVGFINFSPYYRNSEEPVNRVVDSAGIVTITCSEDILSGDTAHEVG